MIKSDKEKERECKKMGQKERTKKAEKGNEKKKRMKEKKHVFFRTLINLKTK